MTTTTAPANPDLVTLTINGKSVTTKKGTLLVEAARQAGIDVPVFCYHPKLKPVGACRMCLVEIEKMPRLQTACTTPVAPGMVVKTQSELAKGGQSAVIALLLANHPLDCPVCDKGGECPLQDNTFGYGPGASKFEEEKRHKDKAFELSDKIVLDRERCILCYRCVRFHEEIPGDRALAVIDRGSYGEIGVMPGETYDSPFQGNTIDICPVGALTSRQYRFRSRPWDLAHTDSIACDDPVGSNIVVDTRDGRVLRVRPRENLDVNDEWIADRTRFGTVPLERTQRLAVPLVREAGSAGALKPASWAEAWRRAANVVKLGASWLASPALTNEALALVAAVADGAVAVAPALPGRAVKGSIASIAKSKSILALGIDVWSEIPMLALWIHKAVAQHGSSGGGASLVVVNEKNGLWRSTKTWVNAKRADWKQALAALDVGELSARPTTFLIGEDLSRDPDAQPILDKLAEQLGADGTGGLVGAPSTWVNGRGAAEILGKRVAASTREWSAADSVVAVGALPAGIVPTGRGVWLTHGLPDEGYDVPAWVDVVIPLAHPYEQAGSFTNLEGRAQPFDAAGIAPGSKGAFCPSDWGALAQLAAELGTPVPRDLRALREHLGQTHETFKRLPKTRTKLKVVGGGA